MKPLLLALASALVACAPRGRAPDASRADATAGSDARPAPPETPLVEALRARAVDDDRPWRAALFSWTPPEQARAVARSGVLLTATARSGYATPFGALLQRLQRRAGVAGAVARALLRDPALERHRYAWASAFATARGFQGRSYGASLVRVALRPDALVLRLDPSDAQPFRLFDRDQREVAIDRFEALRARVAAVYHVRRPPDVPVAFREYVVCNAAALAAWSIATPGVCASLAAERALVARVLAAQESADEGVGAPSVERCWRGGACRDAGVAGLWRASMATAAEHYRPTPANLRALLDAIRACDTSAVVDGPAR